MTKPISLKEALTDKDRNLKRLEIPTQLLQGIEATAFIITRKPFSELITMEKEMRDERLKPNPDMNRFFSNEATWEEFKRRLHHIETGTETLQPEEIILDDLPDTWRRFLTAETLHERDEGFETRAQRGEA